ncbi:Membrane protein insertase YidC [Bienertia sinuspersici]
MINKVEVEKLKGRLGYQNAFGVSSRGKAGGLCIYWKEEVDFTINVLLQNHIGGSIIEEGGEDKHKTWSLIIHLYGEEETPIIFGGDFNEILLYDEKGGGAKTTKRELYSFREVLEECNLMDVGYSRQTFTLERGNSTRVRECLAGFLLFDMVYEHHGNELKNLMRYKSDHSVIVLIKKRRRKKGRQCELTVRKAWEEAKGCGVVGKIQQVSHRLARWSKENYDYLGKQIYIMEKALRVEKMKPITKDSCVISSNVLDDLNEKHEAYWDVPSRVTEIRGFVRLNVVWKTNEDGSEGIIYYEVLFSSRKWESIDIWKDPCLADEKGKFARSDVVPGFSKEGTYSVKQHICWERGVTWSLEVSPKVRDFFWRVCTSSVSVKNLSTDIFRRMLLFLCVTTWIS